MKQERTSELERIRRRRDEWRLAGERVAFTNGCFDLIHVGHVELLIAARGQSDRLIVGLNSDASVRALKPGRPLVSEVDRREVLAGLEMVDEVLIYDEATPQAVIDRLVPDVLVKGADW